jgi:hypothetical protein
MSVEEGIIWCSPQMIAEIVLGARHSLADHTLQASPQCRFKVSIVIRLRSALGMSTKQAAISTPFGARIGDDRWTTLAACRVFADEREHSGIGTVQKRSSRTPLRFDDPICSPAQHVRMFRAFLSGLAIRRSFLRTSVRR